MTEEEKQLKIDELVEAHKAAIQERKDEEIKAGFLNPFGEETTYVEFLAEVKKSNKSVSDYCKKNLTSDQIEWLEKDLEFFNKKNKK
jgi:hypothetical protein